MSLNTVIAFALLLKKITRKGSLGKKNFRNKMRKSSKPTVHTTTTMVSLSSSSDDEEEVQDFQYNNDDYNLMNNKKSNSSIIAPSIKSLQQQQKHNSLKQPLDDLITIVSPQPSEKKSITVISLSTESTESESNISVKRASSVQTENELCQDEAITTAETIDSDQMTIVPSTAVTDEVLIRDFAYPTESPLHYGKSLKPKYSSVSLSSPDFNGREARALFDFTPETEYELPLKTGQTIWVQYRQCSGWLIADVQDETGLIPESYVEFI